MINVELMTKLYQYKTVHNLNKPRKARDGKKRGKMPREPEKLKIGDNILIRDHTSKVFQSKYKDFCTFGLLGKNQVDINDNHGHTTKVHRRDIKKVPMIEKVCRLYEEEQVGKVREGRKTVPSSKMPDLGWDIAESQLQEDEQGGTENNNHHTTLPLQVMITITIVITTLLGNIKSHIQEIPQATRNTAQAIKTTYREICHNRLVQKWKKLYEAAVLAVTLATNMTEHASCTNHPRTINKNTYRYPDKHKPYDEYDKQHQMSTSRPHRDICN